MRPPKTLLAIILGVGLLIIAAQLAGRSVWNSPARGLVVYCAHDAEFSEPILKEFERRTGISVLIRYDTEATKSLGLINLLVQEKSQPRCDVFWNNELLGMLDLQAQGLLEPYRGSGHQRIPSRYKDADGHWTGFAARLRVHIVNSASATKLDAEALDRIWKQEDLDQVAIAKPLYGTTLTHYTVLADLWGLERLQAWHKETRQRGLKEVNGNATVKNLVAQGACLTGLTDSDDFFVAKDQKQPVAMLPVRVGERRRTICIPNCVALIRGSQHREEAQQLIDFLLSEETELKLSQSTSRQVPLGAIAAARLSPEVRELAAWAKQGYDLRPLHSARQACVAWLSEEYLQRPAAMPAGKATVP